MEKYIYRFGSTSIEFTAHAGTDTGCRKENQDNFLIILPGHQGRGRMVSGDLLKNGQTGPDNWPGHMVRLAVADGMGGHRNGKEIAAAAVSALATAPVETETAMAEMIHDIHDRLYTQFYSSDEDSPGTTLTLTDINLETGKAVMGHVGDSRLYRIRQDRPPEQLSCDHTFDEFDYREGELDQKTYEERLKAGRSGIVQALGNGSFGLIREPDGYRPNRLDKRIRLDRAADLPDHPAHADIKTIDLLPKDRFLLATDGLWQKTDTGQWPGPVTPCFLSEKEVAEQVSQALKRGAKDNITLIVFGLDDPKGNAC